MREQPKSDEQRREDGGVGVAARQRRKTVVVFKVAPTADPAKGRRMATVEGKGGDGRPQSVDEIGLAQQVGPGDRYMGSTSIRSSGRLDLPLKKRAQIAVGLEAASV